ncbi:unnamed protein product [Owenia fusiformis]|uniref:Uncharacterized protein n=1 Tax=Owenia fusiformis TaxID=6347 RepID=A0A8S4N2E0_OWEFU|nr:unnamed protein product [Owenia fusiformis]
MLWFTSNKCRIQILPCTYREQVSPASPHGYYRVPAEIEQVLPAGPHGYYRVPAEREQVLPASPHGYYRVPAEREQVLPASPHGYYRVPAEREQVLPASPHGYYCIEYLLRENKYCLQVPMATIEYLLRYIKNGDNLLFHYSRENKYCLQVPMATIEYLLRENKYCLQVPMATIEYLLRYIKNGDNMLLLQLFNKHIHLGANLKSSMNLDLKADKEGKGGTLPSPPENKVIHNEEMLSALKKSIKTIRDGPPCLTSICLYSFLNAYQGMCSSCISNNNKYLCAGFEDAAIRMWSLTPDPIPSQAVTDNVATVHLSGDYIEDIIDRNRPPELGEQKVMRGHAGTVYKVTFTPDSNYILSAGEDTTVRLWDLSTHTNTVAYKGHTFPVWDVDASPQGTLFVSGSHDRTAKLWSTDRIYPIRTYAGHSLDVDCVKFHPNNNYIATGSCDKSVRMWSVQDAKAVRLFQGHRGTVFTVAFSPNGRYLASAGEDRRVKVWDLGSGKLMKDLRGHSDTVYALCFNNESTLLSSGGHDGVLRVWDVQKTVEHSGNQSEGHSPELLASYPVKSTTINYVQYLPNSLLLAVGNLS